VLQQYSRHALAKVRRATPTSHLWERDTEEERERQQTATTTSQCNHINITHISFVCLIGLIHMRGKKNSDVMRHIIFVSRFGPNYGSTYYVGPTHISELLCELHIQM